MINFHFFERIFLVSLLASQLYSYLTRFLKQINEMPRDRKRYKTILFRENEEERERMRRWENIGTTATLGKNNRCKNLYFW